MNINEEIMSIVKEENKNSRKKGFRDIHFQVGETKVSVVLFTRDNKEQYKLWIGEKPMDSFSTQNEAINYLINYLKNKEK